MRERKDLLFFFPPSSSYLQPVIFLNELMEGRQMMLVQEARVQCVVRG